MIVDYQVSQVSLAGSSNLCHISRATACLQVIRPQHPYKSVFAQVLSVAFSMLAAKMLIWAFLWDGTQKTPFCSYAASSGESSGFTPFGLHVDASRLICLGVSHDLEPFRYISTRTCWKQCDIHEVPQMVSLPCVLKPTWKVFLADPTFRAKAT